MLMGNMDIYDNFFGYFVLVYICIYIFNGGFEVGNDYPFYLS